MRSPPPYGPSSAHQRAGTAPPEPAESVAASGPGRSPPSQQAEPQAARRARQGPPSAQIVCQFIEFGDARMFCEAHNRGSLPGETNSLSFGRTDDRTLKDSDEEFGLGLPG